MKNSLHNCEIQRQRLVQEVATLRAAVDLFLENGGNDLDYQEEFIKLGVLVERAPDDVRDSPCDECVCEGRGPCYHTYWSKL